MVKVEHKEGNLTTSKNNKENQKCSTSVEWSVLLAGKEGTVWGVSFVSGTTFPFA